MNQSAPKSKINIINIFIFFSWSRRGLIIYIIFKNYLFSTGIANKIWVLSSSFGLRAQIIFRTSSSTMTKVRAKPRNTVQCHTANYCFLWVLAPIATWPWPTCGGCSATSTSTTKNWESGKAQNDCRLDDYALSRKSRENHLVGEPEERNIKTNQK